MKKVIKFSLIWLLALPLLLAGCKKEESECDSFQNTKAEIQFWQPAGKDNAPIIIQAENDSLFAGTVIFKLNKQYNKVRWLINNDSNYTYNSNEVTLNFGNSKKYFVKAIGEIKFNSKECGNVKITDTIYSSFRTFVPAGAVGLLGKKYEIESTQYPGEKWTFWFQNTNGPINDYSNFYGITDSWTNAQTFLDRTNQGIEPPYLIAVNFPRYENDSFIIRYFESDGYTYFKGKITIWDSVGFDPKYKYGTTIDLLLHKSINSNEISGSYHYLLHDKKTGGVIEKSSTFKGVSK